MRYISKAGCALFALVAALSSCTEMKEEKGYIGQSDIRIAGGRMTPEALLALGRISDPQLSPDGSTILYGVSYNSLEENRSCRNLYVCSPSGGDSRRLTAFGQSVSNARWLSDSRIAFIRGGQIYTADIRGLRGKTPRLASVTKVSDIPAGISGFVLSPDNSKILYISSVPGSVRVPSDDDPTLDKASAYVADDLMYRHWDHWVTSIPHTFVAPFDSNITKESSKDLLTEGERAYELPTEPFGGTEQLSWSPDGRYIAYSCRKKAGREYAFSTNTDIYVYDTVTGHTEAVTNGGGYDTDPVWSPDGNHLAWLSMARDGYEADKTRLMLAQVQSADKVMVSGVEDLTASFKYNAASPVWDPASEKIYFSALYEGVQGIFAASLSGGISLVTKEGEWFDYESPFAVLQDGGILASRSSMDEPTELIAVASDGSSHKITDENGHILSQLKSHKTESRIIKTVDGKDMQTWVLYPPEFDSTKVYPSILICLGGPQGTNSQSWSYRWCYRLMAEQGYVVVLPNRRGTTAFGQEWTEQISGDYPGLNMQDYLSAAKELKKEPYIGKMAACGASYGGYSVYYLAGVHGDVFDCFIAHAGIFDERYMYYETEEMWFPNWDNGGLHEYEYTPGQTGPAGDGVTFGGIRQGGSPWSSEPKAIRHYANSPSVNVTKWHTPILCIHGGMDFRIPYDQGMAAFNCAQMMGVPSRLVVFPDECHWILKPQNALFWHREYFSWLDEWCK